MGQQIMLLWLTLVLLSPDITCLCKQWRSRSVGFIRSQLIWICTVWQTVKIKINWLCQKPTDLDLHCLSISMRICINNLDQVNWLVENLKWVWHLNLFSMARVNIWAHQAKNVPCNKCKMWGFTSSCTCAKSHLSNCSSFGHSFYYPVILLADSEGPYQTVQMCRLIWAFAACIYLKTRAKSHQSICSPFIHSVVSNDSVSGHWRPWSDCMNAQADLGPRCPHMPEETFSHIAAHMYLLFTTEQVLLFLQQNSFPHSSTYTEYTKTHFVGTHWKLWA